jgi:hypothetical protein
VIAAAVPIPDDQAAAFFAALRARLAAGATPAPRSPPSGPLAPSRGGPR